MSISIWRNPIKTLGYSKNEVYYHGNRFMIPGTGSAEAIGSSDTMVGSAAPVLQYGQKVTFSHRPEDGTITCLSEKIGLTCTNKSGGLMHLNREFYVLNKPVPR